MVEGTIKTLVNALKVSAKPAPTPEAVLKKEAAGKLVKAFEQGDPVAKAEIARARALVTRENVEFREEIVALPKARADPRRDFVIETQAVNDFVNASNSYTGAAGNQYKAWQALSEANHNPVYCYFLKIALDDIKAANEFRERAAHKRQDLESERADDSAKPTLTPPTERSLGN
jgi:hypothetical protein